MNAEGATDTRVLVLTPTAKDYELLHGIFERHAITDLACHDLESACKELAKGAGALLIAEEALAGSDSLKQWLQRQPAWSDLPILVMARPGSEHNTTSVGGKCPGNVTVLDRPTRVVNLVSAVQSALRARRRQYEIRDHLAEQKKAEDQLRINDQRKDEFLAVLAHELRNPLAPVSNGLHILNHAYREHAETHAVRQVMERQLASMKRLVDDLLEVSRVTRGKLELKIEDVELSTIIRSAIDVSQPVISAGKHRLEVAIPDQPVYLQADAVRLAQVIANLLNNAAKYTGTGGVIRLTANVLENEVAISIADNGVGIPLDLQPRIFDMFMQVDASRNRSQGGLGIGLTLVKRLVELHGGSVSVASGGSGMGSCFTVRLPLRTVAETVHVKRAVQTGCDLTGLKILIADDNKDAADTLGEMLGRLGASVEVTHGGTEALAMLDLARTEVAILDIGMPDLDGMTVARCIRAQEGGSAVLLIALTGWGQTQDIRNTKAAGFDHHLTKPVDIDQLLGLLATAKRRH